MSCRSLELYQSLLNTISLYGAFWPFKTTTTTHKNSVSTVDVVSVVLLSHTVWRAILNFTALVAVVACAPRPLIAVPEPNIWH